MFYLGQVEAGAGSRVTIPWVLQAGEGVRFTLSAVHAGDLSTVVMWLTWMFFIIKMKPVELQINLVIHYFI